MIKNTILTIGSHGRGGFTIRAPVTSATKTSVILKRLKDKEPNVSNWARNFRTEGSGATSPKDKVKRRSGGGNGISGTMFYGTRTAKCVSKKQILIMIEANLCRSLHEG